METEHQFTQAYVGPTISTIPNEGRKEFIIFISKLKPWTVPWIVPWIWSHWGLE